MNLSPPKFVTWIIALVLGVLGLLGQIAIPALAGIAFWLVLIGLALLLLATAITGL